MSEVLVVLCNTPDLATARSIAAALVDARLAACVSIGAPCESLYRWDGKRESAVEIPLVIKTTVDRYSGVETEIARLHPYAVPEILALPVATGLGSYLAWVRESLGP